MFTFHFECIERFIKPRIVYFVVESFESVYKQISSDFVIWDVVDLEIFISPIEDLLDIERDPVFWHDVWVV